MICYKCNAEIPDNSKVCPMCGVPVEYPKEEPAVSFEPIPEEEAPKGKKGLPKGVKKLLAIGLPAVAVVVAAALLVVSTWRGIKGFFVKTFGDENDYHRYVEAEAFGDYADTVTTIYGRFMDTFADRNDISIDGKVEIVLGEKGKELASQYIFKTDSSEYIDWLEKATIGIKANAKDKNMSFNANLGLTGKDIVSGNIVIDEDFNVYGQIPEINNQYIFAEGEGNFSSGTVAGELKDLDVNKYLPSADKLNSLLKKYIKLVTECIDDAEIDTYDLEVGGVSGEYEGIKIVVDQKLVLQIAKAAATTAQDDKEIKAILENVFEMMDEMGASGDMDFDGFYDMFQEGIEGGADSIDEMIDMLDGDGEEFFTIIDYVDGGSNIIGRSLQMRNDEGEYETVLEYFEITKGSKYGMYLGLNYEGQSVALRGEGKKSGSNISVADGGLYLNMEGQEFEVVKFTTKNLNENDLADGYFNGTVTISLGDDFSKFFMGAGGSMDDAPAWFITLLDLSVEFTGKGNNAKNANETIALYMGDDMLISLNVTAKQAGGSGVKIPNEDDCAWAENSDDMENWLGDIDLEKIISNLESAGVPDDIVDAVDRLADGGFGEIGNILGGSQSSNITVKPNYEDVYGY